MWVFTIYGFFSVSVPYGMKGDYLLIRSRSKEHLELLINRFTAHLGGTPILTTPERDYRFRILVPRNMWVAVMSQLAEEQTWSNFKGEVEKYPTHQASGYARMLHRIWDLASSFQHQVDIRTRRLIPQRFSKGE